MHYPHCLRWFMLNVHRQHVNCKPSLYRQVYVCFQLFQLSLSTSSPAVLCNKTLSIPLISFPQRNRWGHVTYEV